MQRKLLAIQFAFHAAAGEQSPIEGIGPLVVGTDPAAHMAAGMQARSATKRRLFILLSWWGEDWLCSAADRQAGEETV